MTLMDRVKPPLPSPTGPRDGVSVLQKQLPIREEIARCAGPIAAAPSILFVAGWVADLSSTTRAGVSSTRLGRGADDATSSSFRMEGMCDMLLSRLVGAAVLTASATLTIVGVANAQDDRDCADFSNQAEAQRFFDSAASNYHRLDADNDGIACEQLPAPSHVPTTRRTRAPEPPVGAIDTGDGSTVNDSASDDSGTLPLLLGLAGLGAVSATAVAARRARRSG